MNNIHRFTGLTVMTLFAAGVGTGCAGMGARTGFLSDYSKLTKHKDGQLRYVNEAKVGTFDKFIIDPVTIYFHDKAKGKDTDPRKLQELEHLMHEALIRELSKRYTVVGEPGPGVARIRIAITDVKKDSPALNAIPHTRITGVGLGHMSMEGEVIDTMTGEQIGAVIQSRKGRALSLEGLKEWSSVEAAINEWAKELCGRIDKAHGR